MTAFAGDDAAAAARSAEARELIDRAQSQDVLLTVLSAWDLCALGGPRQGAVRRGAGQGLGGDAAPWPQETAGGHPGWAGGVLPAGMSGAGGARPGPRPGVGGPARRPRRLPPAGAGE